MKYINVLNIEQVDYLIELIAQNLVELKPSLYIKRNTIRIYTKSIL